MKVNSESNVWRVSANDDAAFRTYMGAILCRPWKDCAVKKEAGYNYYLVYGGEFGLIREALVTDYREFKA